MRTQVMRERAVGLPWLEHYPTEGSAPQQIALDRVPFTLGRGEDSDLPLSSSRVSRRHAVIDQQDDGYHVRDLGSTNGTFVNGKQIDDALLADGDLLVMADVELGFFLGHAADARGSATQVLDGPAGGADSEAGWQLVDAARRLDEMLTHRAVVTRFEPIVDLGDGTVWGYRAGDAATPSHPQSRDAWQLLLATDCRLGSRFRRLRRMMAVEQSAELPDQAALLLPLDEIEIGDADLAGSLERLAQLVLDVRPMVIVVPEAAVSEVAYLEEFFGRLRSAEMSVAYDGVAGTPPATKGKSPVRPDYLVLADRMVQDLHRSANRRQQVEAVVKAAHDCGCEVIATSLTQEAEVDACRELGCRFGQGEAVEDNRPATRQKQTTN